MVYTAFKPILKSGCHHGDVVELQQLLSQKLRPIPQTGRFDYDTEIAVKNFQARMFLTPDGIVGPLTWQALYASAPVGMPSLKPGDHGSAVVAIQEILSIDGYYGGAVDGQFGPRTEAAVRRLQREYHQPVTGTVELPTWQILSQI